MVKRNRNYELVVETSDGKTVTIRPPFTVEFNTERTYYSRANSFNIRVYNLSVETRNKIRKDTFTFSIRKCSLRAGYGDNLTEIAKGIVDRCYTARSGTDVITNIVGADVGVDDANSLVSNSYAGGTLKRAIIADLMQSLKKQGLAVGSVGQFTGTIDKAASYVGDPVQILNEITGGGFFIDNGVAHALQPGECLDDKVLIIDGSSGLLGTPELEQTIVNVDILFEPMCKIQQLCQVKSITEDRFNGLYKISSIRHSATISESVCGSATTSLGLVSGFFTPQGAV